jgi:hypothetical protein
MSHPTQKSSAFRSSGSEDRGSLTNESLDRSRPGPQPAKDSPAISDDADLLAEGAGILEREKQSAKERATQIAYEEEYYQAYRVLRDEILLIQGEHSNAQFHGLAYDASKHLPCLAELLVSYFQVLARPEHNYRLRSINESAVLQRYKLNDTSGLALVCLRYTLRLFQEGVTGVFKRKIERKLNEINENEQLAGVWKWILRIGFELEPDNPTQLVVNNDSTSANKRGEPGLPGPERIGAGACKQRPCHFRDRAWLEWHDDQNAETHHSPAKIRDKWNRMSAEERKRISPKACNKIGEKRTGLDVVKKAVQKARKDLSSTKI